MILGAILAGGRSIRFGADKAQALWQGRPLIDHAIHTLSAITSTVIVCGRQYEGVTSVGDRPAPDLGPLGGLNAALHCAQNEGFDRVITMPCDSPWLGRDLIRALHSATDDAYLAALPVIGLWNSAHAALLDEHIRCEADRSLRHWARRIGAIALDHEPPPNINRPSDLAALHAR